MVPARQREALAVTTVPWTLASCASSFWSSPLQSKQLLPATQAKSLGAIPDFRFHQTPHPIYQQIISSFQTFPGSVHFSPPPLLPPCLNHHHLSSIFLQEPPNGSPHFYLCPPLQPIPHSCYSNSLKHKSSRVTSLQKVPPWLPFQSKSQIPYNGLHGPTQHNPIPFLISSLDMPAY